MAPQPVATPILLCASVPDPKRDAHYWHTADLVAIRDAVIALAQTVLPQYTLIYGGHPAITPIVRLVAETLGQVDHVILYQSDWFSATQPSDNEAFRNVVRTPKGSTLEESLQIMRARMLADNPFIAAFFIGGMNGVEQEFRFLRTHAPHVPCYPIASSGGAALELLNEFPDVIPAEFRNELEHNLAYLPLFSRILAHLPKH